MYRIIKENKWPLLIGVYIFLTTFFMERLFFNVDLLNIHNHYYVGIKIILLAVLLSFTLFINFVIKKVIQKDEHYIFASKIFFLYLAIMLILLLLVWPGLWRDDEFHIFSGCKDFYMNAYQHYMTSCMYIMFLMIIPCAGGIIFCQQIVYSLIVAYIAYNLHKYYFKGRWCVACLIPFLFIPVLDSNLYPMRCCMYAFIELFFLSLIAFRVKSGKKCDWGFAILFSVSAIILAVWRTEGLYYILIAPIIFLAIFWKKSTKLEKVLVSICIVIITFIGVNIQNNLAKEKIGDNTFIISTLGFIHLEQNNQVLYQREDIVEALDGVVDLQILQENGVGAIWSDLPLVKQGYTHKEYAEFQKAYVKLIVYDTKRFIKFCWDNYIKTNGIGVNTVFLGNTETLYDEDAAYEVREYFKGQSFNTPIFKNLRKAIILFCECKASNNAFFKVMRVLLYNTIVPTLIILGLTLMFLCRRKWAYVSLGILALVKIPLIFATAPSLLFMYYYPVYLEGYFIGVTYLIISLYNYKKNK